MVMVSLFFVTLNYVIRAKNVGKAMISYDEGPSKNLERAVILGQYLRTPLVFFLDPYIETFDRKIVETIIRFGHEVGLSIKEKLDDDEKHITRTIRKCIATFIEKSGYRPVLVRLPAVGIISDKAIKIIRKLGYFSSLPTIDSEDDQNPNYPPFLFRALNSLNKDENSVSIVFRDRMSQSVNLLQKLVQALRYNGFHIVSAREYYEIDTDLKETLECVFKSTVERNKEVIEVSIATDNGDIFFDIDIPYSLENFVEIKTLCKERIVGTKKKDEIISKLKKLETDCKSMDENEDLSDEDSKNQDISKNCDLNVCKSDVSNSSSDVNLVGFIFLTVFWFLLN